MSYTRWSEDCEFYSYPTDYKGKELLQIFFGKDIQNHTCGILIDVKQAKILHELTGKYLKEMESEENGSKHTKK